jgi:GWxTD domain-containing protein
LTAIFSASSFAQMDKGGELKFDVDVARFRGPDNFTYLELYFSIPRSQIEHKSSGDRYVGKYEIDVNVLRNDSLVVADSLDNEDGVKSLDEISPGQNLYELIPLYIQKGEYRLRTRLEDLSSQKVGWVEFDIVVNPFSRELLDISDIQLGLQVRKDNAKSKFVKNGYRIIPNPGAMYGGDWSELYYYAEIYNLEPLTTGSDSTYTVEVSLKDTDGNVVKELPPKTNLRKGASVVELGEVNLGLLVPALNRIEITVTDNATSKSVSADKQFFISHPRGLMATANAQSRTDKSPADEFHGMPEEEIDEQFDFARFIATKEEKEAYKKLNLEGKRAFIASFWSRRDYEPGTEFNEFKHEYLRRVRLADSRFHAGSNKPGWRTDLGRIFVLYGEPERIDRYPGARNNYQIWRYDHIEGGVEFVFVDVRGFGELRLVHSTKRNEINDSQWRTRYAR